MYPFNPPLASREELLARRDFLYWEIQQEEALSPLGQAPRWMEEELSEVMYALSERFGEEG